MQIARRRGMKKAIVALARHIACDRRKPEIHRAVEGMSLAGRWIR
jgi:hypothetical protein